MKCYLLEGNGILIVTAVLFSYCKHNNGIIIFLFKKLTRTVQPVSAWRGSGLRVSACLKLGLLIQTMLTEVDVSRQITYVLSSSVLHAHVPLGDAAHIYGMSRRTY